MKGSILCFKPMAEGAEGKEPRVSHYCVSMVDQISMMKAHVPQ